MASLPKGWVETSLSQIVIPRNEKVSPASIGDKPFIGLEHVESHSSKIIGTGKCSDMRSAVARFHAGDILYGRLRPYLNKVTRPDFDGGASAEMIVLKMAPDIDPSYVHKLIMTQDFLNFTSQLDKGDRPRVKYEDVSQYKLALPPANEQKRIAEKLDNLFTRSRAAREELTRIPRLIGRYKQAILSAAFSGELTQDWRNIEGKDSEWEHTDIQSVATVGTGSTPLKSNKSFYSASGTPWVTSAATGKPYIDTAEEFVTKEAIAANRLKIFPIGTLLVAMYGEGKTRGQVSELRINATINQACAAIVVDPKKILKDFLRYILVAGYLDMRELATGGNQPNLNLTKIKEYPVLLPSLKEQNEIVARIKTAFTTIDTIATQTAAGLHQLSHLEAQCLNKAFRGELVPQDPNDEPASILLERLRTEAVPANPKRKGRKAKG